MAERTADFRRAQIEAEKLIEKNAISTFPIRVQELAEGVGLSIGVAEFDDGAISGFIDLEKKMILVNRFDSFYRQRFTAAHELGHWILHREEVEKDTDITILYRKMIDKGDRDPLEKEANCFAANLLVPLPFLEKVSKSASSKELAHSFMVSEAVMAFRRELLSP